MNCVKREELLPRFATKMITTDHNNAHAHLRLQNQACQSPLAQKRPQLSPPKCSGCLVPVEESQEWKPRQFHLNAEYILIVQQSKCVTP